MVKDIAEMMVIRPITPVSSNIMRNIFIKCILHVHIMVGLVDLWCLMALSTIFQLYRDGQFYWRSTRRKPVESHLQTLSYNVVLSTPRHERGSNSQH